MIINTGKFFPIVSACVLAGTVFLSSCKDDEAESIRPTVEIPTDFSDLTDEQNKQNLESNGVEFVNNLTTLQNSEGVQTSISLVNWLNAAPLPENGRKATSNKAFSVIQLLARFGQGTASSKDVLAGMRVREEDPQTPQELFDDVAGTYEYSVELNDWIYEAGADEIVFKFPSSETETTNNAEFAIYGLATVAVTNEAAEYEGDLPTALQADLTVDGAKVIEYTFAASYKANGEPTAVSTSLTIQPFKFTLALKNTTAEVSSDYSLTMNNENLISFGAGASGNFNTDNVSEDETAVSDVINSASSYLQVMDIKFAGNVNVKTLEDQADLAQTIEEEAAAWNAATELVVFYASSKQKIADGEFYGEEGEEEYTWCWDTDGDGIEDQCQTYTESYSKIDIRLVFADGSKSDMATYLDAGFEEMEEALDDFVTSLEDDLD